MNSYYSIMAFKIGLKILRRINEDQEKTDMKSEAQKSPSKTLRDLKGTELVVSVKSKSNICLMRF